MAGHSAHFWAHYWALLGAPDLFGGLHHEAQLSDLLIPGQRIAVQGGGEAALRGQAQLVDVHELAGLLDPALDVVLGFQLSPSYWSPNRGRRTCPSARNAAARTRRSARRRTP